jgi:hypothetical protein
MNDETKPQAKKQWTKPELIVLVRSNPVEAVLTGCKGAGQFGAGVNNDGCFDNPFPNCTLCSSGSTS